MEQQEFNKVIEKMLENRLAQNEERSPALEDEFASLVAQLKQLRRKNLVVLLENCPAVVGWEFLRGYAVFRINDYKYLTYEVIAAW